MRRALALAAVALAAAATPAAAHVEVLPGEVARGEAVEFTVRVPVERSVDTTQVRLEFPDQVTVFSFAEPPPGWTARPVRGDDGRFSAVVWSGGRIGPDRYADFRLLGTPVETGTAVWPARQTYADGRTKPWTGPPEADGAPAAETGPTAPGPAAAVQIVEPGEEAAPATGGGVDADEDSGAAIWLGVIAIGISALALLALGYLWSTRPARLPGDEEPR
ncbi:DUF1775 domain-containing protein [Miltoncostaea marina]|uniref:DUF1775 domain-containing protein n=1 Tax=Miltoncostaea marina TaxID=2843215 RepID=UPI001C3D784B|nr:DUF1775 domain-containing protein [Miltoncostaea marina]